MMDVVQGRHIPEVMEDRFGRRSTIISTQLPVSKWHEIFDDSTVADAILDRIIHNSHRFGLEGQSLRRKSNEAQCR